MAFVNENYLQLKSSYLFSEIAKRTKTYTEKNPDKSIIRLGIGDVTQALPNAAIAAMHKAVDEMANVDTFRGYGPEQGYPFLKQAIISAEYTPRGVKIDESEIFISDGSKSDTGNIGDIFATNNTVAITDPVYPVYVDTNIMAGRNIKYISCTAEQGFNAQPPDFAADIVYLCSPNNPTGTALDRDTLTAWVKYALKNRAIILFDAAYEAFITEPDIPHSIYEIEGARQCAIEFKSLSKRAGFTGTRCAYTVIPTGLMGNTLEGTGVYLNQMWNRRHTTKFNGVPYIIQRGAEAVYSPQGLKETARIVAYYLENAKIIRETLTGLGLTIYGGFNAPYIWLKCPFGLDSWSFFDKLLFEANVVGTPGVGFGQNGEGYFRLTAFGGRQPTLEALERIKKLF